MLQGAAAGCVRFGGAAGGCHHCPVCGSVLPFEAYPGVILLWHLLHEGKKSIQPVASPIPMLIVKPVEAWTRQIRSNSQAHLSVGLSCLIPAAHAQAFLLLCLLFSFQSIVARAGALHTIAISDWLRV